MDKMNNLSKWLIGGVVVVVIIVLAVVYGGGGSQTGSGSPQSTSTTATTTTASTSAASPTTTPSPAPSPASPSGKPGTPAVNAPTPVPPRIVIKYITPVTNDQWKIGTQYPIAWNNEAGVTGEIDLLDSKTKAEIGVILSETGPHQTSYSWNVRDYFLARYNPLKKNVVPGTYLIELKFDGNNLPNLISGPITVSN